MVLHPRFDVDTVITDLINKKISLFAGVPTMYMAMAARARDRERVALAAVLRLGRRAAAGRGGEPLRRVDRLQV